MEITIYDRKLYRVEMSQCQKKYMERLYREYIELLISENLGAKRFCRCFKEATRICNTQM